MYQCQILRNAISRLNALLEYHFSVSALCTTAGISSHNYQSILESQLRTVINVGLKVNL